MPDNHPGRGHLISAGSETSLLSNSIVPAVTDTNTATVYRSPHFPLVPWSLGIGFDDVLAVLEPGQDPPLDAADAALAAAGLRRIGDWRPHFPRADWGWRKATVTPGQSRTVIPDPED